MHRATLYYHNREGKKDLTKPLGYVTVDDDAHVTIRMERDDSVLYDSSLENLGYSLMWYFYPITQPTLAQRSMFDY